MSLSDLQVGGGVGFVLVGLVTTIGAFAVSLLVSSVVHAGFSVAGWLGRNRRRAGGTVTPSTTRINESFRLGAADHALVARQAWWRLRC
jgi:hypothetical protein